jgi:SWI/SNF-related matrix-associated actin-dependent regulator of chromatin subfamily A member 5
LADISSLHELWALFHFLYPDVFTEKSADAFKSAFDLTKGTYDTKFIEAASALLSKVMLRRMKADMDEIKLPPKEELLVYVPLTPLQRFDIFIPIDDRFWYKRLITRLDSSTLNDVFKGTVNTIKDENMLLDISVEEDGKSKSANSKDQNEWRKLLNLLMQLRKVCNQ